jgi:hypothetical protein
MSIGVSANESRKMLQDLKEKGSASTSITSEHEKEDSYDTPAKGTIPRTGDRTYEPGNDGKPKLFPPRKEGYSSTSEDTYETPKPIPVGQRVGRYKLTMPELAPPPAKYTLRDYSYGLNTDDATVQAMMDERPELGDLIEQYNIDVTNYNLAKQKGDAKESQALYKQLRLEHAELTNAAKSPLDREGTGAYPVEPFDLEYPALDTIGSRVMLKHVRAKTERTAALGLDDEIDAYNEAALKLNKLTSEGASTTPEYKAALTAYEKERNKIARVEEHPEYAAGTVKPKLLSKKYPKRVQELVNLALDNKPLNLTEADVALLEQYPAAGRPVLEYSEYMNKYPEDGEVGNEKFVRLKSPIDTKLKAVRDSGFIIGPAGRPFAEGKHAYPEPVKNVIDRIVSHNSTEPIKISQRERQAIAEFPDLEAQVAKYENDFLAAQEKYPLGETGTRGYSLRRTARHKATSESAAPFYQMKRDGYRGAEPVAASVAEVEANIEKDSAELRATSTMLKSALAGRAPRGHIEELYRRQNMLRARLAAERADVSGRGTYLGDVSRENLPSNEAERKAFQRLQNVEREFQGHQDALFEYNDQERGLDYTGMTRAQAYQARLALLEGIAVRQGLSDVYDKAAAKDVDVMEEDADTVVNLPDNPDAAANQGEGSERAEIIDPDERALFLRSRAEEKQEFKNWEAFSYVAPGFGLGGPKYNTIQRANALTERRRFASVTMPPARQQIMNPPRPIEMRGPVNRQPAMIPIYESDFGPVHYEDAYHNDYQRGRRIIFTDPYQDDADRRGWTSPQNIYQPDNAGYAFAQRVNTSQGRHMVPIGEVSKPREYYGTNLRFHETNGPNPRLQNRANGLPLNGEATMITTERSGRRDLAPRPVYDAASAMRAGIYSTRH